MSRYYNATIRNLAYRLRKFKDILNGALEEEIREHAEEIVKLVSDNQLYDQGINGKGIEIMSYMPYAARTIKLKRKKGQPTTRVTLRDTGKFHESFNIVFNEGGFYIRADDEKTKYLVARYGPEIFRLTNENLTIMLREFIRPGLIKRLKEKI